MGRAVIEAVILLTASRGNASQVLREAATAYKVDTDAITAKIEQEFTAKERGKTVNKAAPKSAVKAQPKAVRKSAAA